MKVFSNQILRGVVGSTAHGLEIAGQDDRDEMGVFIEPPINVIGLNGLDHYIQRDRPDGVRSEPDELDLTMYSLRKFVRLAAGGSPAVILLLWLKEYTLCNDYGKALIGMRQSFISKQSGLAFLRDLTAQKKRLAGAHSKNMTHPELVAAYGHGTKSALRLGYQGIELLRDGKITLPMVGEPLDVLRSVQLGKVNFENVIGFIETAERELLMLAEKETREVDYNMVNTFLVEMHKLHWGEKK